MAPIHGVLIGNYQNESISPRDKTCRRLNRGTDMIIYVLFFLFVQGMNKDIQAIVGKYGKIHIIGKGNKNQCYSSRAN
jgi:hypothetical protein